MIPEPAEWRAADAAQLLRVPGPHTHKYSRGVLGVRTGSAAYPGAAVLGVEAAWRTGVGLVRYFSPRDDAAPEFGLPSPAAAVLARRPETVFARSTSSERSRCDAWVIGSGTDPTARSFAEREELRRLLEGDAPVVVDAGALDLVGGGDTRAPIVVTPHAGEFASLQRASGATSAHAAGDAEADRVHSVRGVAQSLGITVLLKGSRTIVASPSGWCGVYGPASAWLATAGTGDVLAGILGALVATNVTEVREDRDALARLGLTAALLHDHAAQLAAHRAAHAQDRSDAAGPVIALDVASAVPAAFASLLG